MLREIIAKIVSMFSWADSEEIKAWIDRISPKNNSDSDMYASISLKILQKNPWLQLDIIEPIVKMTIEQYKIYLKRQEAK